MEGRITECRTQETALELRSRVDFVGAKSLLKYGMHRNTPFAQLREVLLRSKGASHRCDEKQSAGLIVAASGSFSALEKIEGLTKCSAACM